MIIAPSVLSLDFTKLNEQMNIINQSNAKWVHFDVMDGHFVPNLTFGPDILKAIKRISPLVMDVHIMVDKPMEVAKMFVLAKADIITFHYEACNHDEIIAIIQYLKSTNTKVGISIKPNTKVDVLLPYLNDVDLILIMSVEPGFGGQSFIKDSLNKVAYLFELKKNHNYQYLIEIDGGINNITGKLAKQAGVDVLVSGSYIFKGDIIENINSLL